MEEEEEEDGEPRKSMFLESPKKISNEIFIHVYFTKRSFKSFVMYVHNIGS